MSAQAAERRLAAILHGDVVGSSRLMAEDEDAAIRLVTAYREEIELLTHQHQGRIVDFHGDEFLAEFSSAVHAVQCAIEIQSVLRARNAHLPPEQRMEFRIGVHLGEVRSEGERLFGVGVSVAARIQALAEPGGLCISGEVHKELRNRLELTYEDLGEQEVKNIPEPVQVFRVKIEAEAVPERAPTTTRRAVLAAAAPVLVLGVIAGGWWIFRPAGPTAPGVSTPIRSLAVLPLENLSGDPDQDYVADGMTEALIGELAKLGSLRVISRTSILRYKQSELSLPEIASQLGVDGVIEGTVIREADRVRVTAQLIDGRSDTHLWSDTYDRELSSVLALHSDVARAVAEQLRIELTPEEQAGLTSSRPVDPLAYDAYLRGLQLRKEISVSGNWAPQAHEQFERAVELDPDFAEAWAQLGFTKILLGQRAEARRAAERALELNDRLGGAHMMLALVRYSYDWDFSGALRASQRAAELSPNDPNVLAVHSWSLFHNGRRKEALVVSERMIRVAPLDVLLQGQRVHQLYFHRQYQRALEQAERVRELSPEFISPTESTIYGLLGRPQEAHHALIAFYEQCGTPCDWQREAMERGWAEGGPMGANRAWIEAAISRAVSPSGISLSYAWVDADEAFEWLETAYRERDEDMYLISNPGFDPIRRDPRFVDLLRRVGFPEIGEDPGELAGVGRALAITGRPAEGIPSLERAMELSPTDPRLARWLYYMALAHFAAERYEAATDWAQRALQHDRGKYTAANAYLLLASSYGHMEDPDKARQALDDALRLWPRLELDQDLRFSFNPTLRDRYIDGLRKAGLEGRRESYP